MVEFGAHLPLIDFDRPHGLADLTGYARAAAGLGFGYLCANDHLGFRRPWLDGPTVLAAVAGAAGSMTLATTVALPVLRGPVPLAKALATLDVLSGGRLVAGVGPGSSAADYAAAGLDFAERWRRFDEAVAALRALLHEGVAAVDGEFYATGGIELAPAPVQRPGPPIWVASWGSPAGLRRVARLGDGWLASAYNTTPERLRAGLDALAAAGGPSDAALATAWLYVSDDRAAAERVLAELLAPALGRPAEALAALPLPIGPAEVCAERLAAFAAAGARRIFLWPLGDELGQLERFQSEVAPLLAPLLAGHGPG
jgi:alkanesulfonate monooxygenase SsuD/methylene tetrahydromethanopterin reductase-like flavin-dependent oxidoreductase (luciferase family)